jgi:hypothetical protein
MVEIDPRHLTPHLHRVAAVARTGAAEQFNSYAQFFHRAIARGLLDPIFSPLEAATVAVKNDVAIPMPLRDRLPPDCLAIDGTDPKVQNKKVTNSSITRRLNSALQIIAGLIIGGYNPAPDKPIEEIVTEIMNDMDRAGLSMDRTTINGYVKPALEQYRNRPNSD